jgi:hypothetical protein
LFVSYTYEHIPNSDRLQLHGLGFSWVWKRHQEKNRFNGLPHTLETVETVPGHPELILTPLKRVVNEKKNSSVAHGAGWRHTRVNKNLLASFLFLTQHVFQRLAPDFLK